jgi:tetratricopeptide (TPR) repeat protein
MSMTRFSFSYLLLCLLSLNVAGQKNSDENFLKGKAFYQMQENDSALHYLSLNLKTEKDNPNALYLRGLIYLNQNKNELALQDFLNCEKTQKNLASYQLSKTYVRLGDITNALIYLDLNLRSTNKVSEKEIFMDKDFSRLENNEEWKRFWNNSNYFTGYDATLTEADYLIKTKKYAEAADLLSEELKGGYRKSPLYAKRAEVYIAIYNYRLALSDLTAAIDGDRRNAKLYIRRADTEMMMEKYGTALEDYNLALKYNPDQFEVYLKRAQALSKNDRYEEAIKDILFYQNFFPEDAEAFFQAGNIHKDKGKYFDALKNYNECLKRDQSKAEYFMGRGESYLATRTYRYAYNDFSMTLDIDPENAYAYFLKAKSSLQLGDKEGACFSLKKAYQYGYYEAKELMDKNCQ